MNSGLFHNKLKRWKSFWLIPVVMIFFVSAVVSLVQLKQSINILDGRYGTSVWALFQLKTELRRFHDSLSIYNADPSTLEQVQERYDILWSRFPVTLNGIDGEQIRKVDGAVEAINEAFTTVKTFENVIFEQLQNAPPLATEVKAQLLPHLKAIDNLALDNYHLNNDFYNRGDQEVLELQEQLIWLMFGLIFSGTLLLLSVLRENQINRFQAEHDSLTGLPNRAYLRQVLSDNCRSGRTFALHLIDLNGFKDINDSLGHYTGDLMLKAVADRLTHQIDLKHNCTTCRLGGDEFAIVQADITNELQIKQLSNTIIGLLESPFEVENHQCLIGASIGSTLYPDHGRDGSTLMSHADIAMYKAKEHAPESNQKLFKFSMINKINRKQQLQRDLRTAIDNGELHLVYQPILSMHDGKTRSLEALLRWNHPVYDAVPPLEVIAVAEQYGLTEALGRWLINETSRQLKAWQEEGMPLVPISINVCPSMYQLNLIDLINTALKDHQLSKGLIWIEITEDTTIQMIKQVKELLPKLSDQGIRIALDDFGTGLSSLSHLQQLPIHTLKIDRSFITNFCNDQTSRDLVKHIINIGHDLGLTVVAEGIEDAVVADKLRDLHCDFAQGYFFSRPILPEKVTGYVTHSFCSVDQVEKQTPLI